MAKIYVACLAAYNNGILHGSWIDLTGATVGRVKEKIQEVLKASPIPNAEEWAIHDYDDDVPCGLQAWGEYPDLQRLITASELVSELGEAFEAWLTLDHDRIHKIDPCDWHDEFNDAYCGTYRDGAGYAEEYFEETGLAESIPAFILNHIDWDSVWNNELRYDLNYHDGGIDSFHVFTQ